MDRRNKKAVELKKLVDKLDWNWDNTTTLHVSIPKSIAIYFDILRLQKIPKGKYLTVMFGKMNKNTDFDKLEGIMKREDIEELKKIIRIVNGSIR